MSKLIDKDFYLARYPDVVGTDPAKHYKLHGWREGRAPNPAFDPGYFLDRYPEARVEDCDPLSFYEANYRDLVMDTHPLFSETFYLGRAGLTVKEDVSPLEHFLTKGWKLEYDPHPLFDLAHYKSVANLGPSPKKNPFADFILRGAREDLSPSPFFDPRFYRSLDSTLANPEINPLVHFLIFGWKEGKDPHPDFPMALYRRMYPGVEGVNPLLHFLANRPEDCRAPSEYHLYSVRARWHRSYRASQPIPSIQVEPPEPRLNLVVHGTSEDSWTETALQMLAISVDLANSKNFGLRILARDGLVSIDSIETVIRRMGRKLPARVDLHTDMDRDWFGKSGSKIEVTRADRFFTADRMLAMAAMETRLEGRVVCPLLPPLADCEDDSGSEWFLSRLWNRNDILWVASGIANRSERGESMPEPVGEVIEVPSDLVAGQEPEVSGRKVFLLISDQASGGTAELCGLEAVNRLKGIGLLDREEWDIVLMARNPIKAVFDDGSWAKPIGRRNGFETMGWVTRASVIFFVGSSRFWPLVLETTSRSGKLIFTIGDDRMETCGDGARIVLPPDCEDWTAIMADGMRTFQSRQGSVEEEEKAGGNRTFDGYLNRIVELLDLA